MPYGSPCPSPHFSPEKRNFCFLIFLPTRHRCLKTPQRKDGRTAEAGWLLAPGPRMVGLLPIVLLALPLGALGVTTCPPLWDQNRTTPLCTCELTACDNCLCQSSGATFNLTDYYAQVCQGRLLTAGLYVAIIIPFVVLILGAVLAYVIVRRRKDRSIGLDKRTSNASEASHGQPRYIIRHAGLLDDGVKGSASQEYENIFVDPLQVGTGGQRGLQNPKPSRPPAKPQETDASHGDQPIYANTQEIYYNYVGQKATETPNEGVYVIPD